MKTLYKQYPRQHTESVTVINDDKIVHNDLYSCGSDKKFKEYCG